MALFADPWSVACPDRPVLLAFVSQSPPPLPGTLCSLQVGPRKGPPRGLHNGGRGSHKNIGFVRHSLKRKILFNYVCVYPFCHRFVLKTKPRIQTSLWPALQLFHRSGVRLEIVTSSLFSQGTNSWCGLCLHAWIFGQEI